MKATHLTISLNSEDPARLSSFYRDVLELPGVPEIGETAFSAGGTNVVIDSHSGTKGAAKEPTRYMLNFNVDDIAAEEGRLRERGVTFIRSQGKEYWGGIISTFVDPDGNYCQLIEYRPE
jgi:predicted enzyme related to lactoylglutathione lyase